MVNSVFHAAKIHKIFDIAGILLSEIQSLSHICDTMIFSRSLFDHVIYVFLQFDFLISAPIYLGSFLFHGAKVRLFFRITGVLGILTHPLFHFCDTMSASFRCSNHARTCLSISPYFVQPTDLSYYFFKLIPDILRRYNLYLVAVE